MNWIKFDTSTSDKPEVIAIAAALKIDQDAVIGKLLRLWSWADANSTNATAMPISRAFIDRLTDRRGFAQAMIAAGWLIEDEATETFTFPNFDRHNGTTAKARAASGRRMTATRERRKNEGPAPSPSSADPSPRAPHSQPSLAIATHPENAAPPPQPERNIRCENVADEAQPQAQRKAQPEKNKRREDTERASTAGVCAQDSFPPLHEVQQEAQRLMVPPECAQRFWNDCEASQWVNRHGQPIAQWRPLFANFATAWKANHFRDRRSTAHSQRPPRHPAYDPHTATQGLTPAQILEF